MFEVLYAVPLGTVVTILPRGMAFSLTSVLPITCGAPAVYRLGCRTGAVNLRLGTRDGLHSQRRG